MRSGEVWSPPPPPPYLCQHHTCSTVAHMVHICAGTYTSHEVTEMERAMLGALGYAVAQPTAYTFLHRALSAITSGPASGSGSGEGSDTAVAAHLATFLLELAATDYDSLCFAPSQLASAAALLAAGSSVGVPASASLDGAGVGGLAAPASSGAEGAVEAHPRLGGPLAALLDGGLEGCGVGAGGLFFAPATTGMIETAGGCAPGAPQPGALMGWAPSPLGAVARWVEGRLGWGVGPLSEAARFLEEVASGCRVQVR